MTKLTNTRIYQAAIAASLLAAGAAHAQTSVNVAMAASTTAQSQTVAIDEQVIVTTTAQKRFENLQAVPLAVQVITPEQLDVHGVRGFQDLGAVAPSLVIRGAENPVNSNVSIRGVGTAAFGAWVETSVAVTVDGAAVPFMARVFSALPDIAQIEVLRGPQSTLYGKAASAGLIKIMTVQPTDDFHVRANMLATGDDEYGANVSVTGPFTDTLGYVLSLGYSDWAGNVDNLATGADVNGREAFNGRGKLRWEATPDMTFTLSGNYIDGGTTVGRPFIRMAPGALLRGTAGQTSNVTMPGVTISETNQDVSNNTRSATDYSGWGTLLRSEANIGKLNILSLTAYDSFEIRDILDQDDTSSTLPIGSNFQDGTWESELFTQELRLLSPGDEPFRYALGAYYAKAEFKRPFVRGQAYSQADWVASTGSTQIAGFGQIDWEFLPKLTATVGGRYQNETIEYNYTDNRSLARFANESEDSVGTYRLGLSYQWTPDVMVFAGHTTGYKGQAYDLGTGFDAARAAQPPVRPETSVDTEFGVRTQLFNRRVTFNATYFNTDYTDLQAQSIETLSNGSQVFRLTNVGGLKTQGVELETAARIGSGFSFTGGVTYLDASYSSFPVAPCYSLQTAALGCTGTPARQNLTGATAIQSPEWKAAISAEYERSLNGEKDGFVQASFNYQSDLEYVARDPQAFQPAFSIVNLAVGVRAHDNRWEAKAFVNNLFDEQYYANLVNSAGNFGGQIATQAVLPRDYRRYAGVRFALNY